MFSCSVAENRILEGNVGLTPEDRERILAEETKRAEEQRYREQVRRELQKPDKVESVGWKVIAVLAAIFVLSLIAVFVRNSSDNTPGPPGSSAPLPVIAAWKPETRHIVSPLTEVRPGHIASWNLHVDPKTMRNYRLQGHFSVSGGAGNDIAAILCTEEEFANWSNGHQAHGYYVTPGPETTGSFDVRLPPGEYVLAFSNKMSLVATKTVAADVTASFEQLQ